MMTARMLMTARLLLSAGLLFAGGALAQPAPYLVLCHSTETCDGAPTGSAINRIIAAPGFNPGTGLTIIADDGRALWSPTPSLAQQAGARLAVGLMIASAGTPAVNGLYATDPASRATIAEVTASINAGQGFPGGGSTMDFTLADGRVVTFPSTAVFLAVAVAIRDFVYGCAQVINGRSGSLPTASVTIS